MRDTAQKAMESPTVELKTQLAAWNQTLHSSAMLRKEPSFAEKEGYQALIDLTTHRLLADYGDYLGEHCPELRRKATVLKQIIPEISMFIEGKNWTEVQEILEDEEYHLKGKHICIILFHFLWTFGAIAPAKIDCRCPLSRLGNGR